MAHGKPFGGRTAVDIALDSEDAVDALYGLNRKWRDDDTLARFTLQLGGDVGKFEEVSPRMGPTGSVGNRPFGPTGVIKRVIAGIIVGLKDAPIASEMPPAVLALAVPGIVEQCRRCPPTCKRRIIADISPHPGDVGLVLCQARHGGVVAVEAPGTERVRFEQQKNRLHSGSDRTDLIGKRRKAERDALALEAIALAIEWLVQPELVERKACEEMRAKHGARRDVKRRWRLRDGLARSAGKALAHGLDDLVLGRHSLKRTNDALAKLAQVIRTAARTVLLGGNNDPLDGKTWRKLPARLTLACEGFDSGRFCSCLLRSDLIFGCSGF